MMRNKTSLKCDDISLLAMPPLNHKYLIFLSFFMCFFFSIPCVLSFRAPLRDFFFMFCFEDFRRFLFSSFPSHPLDICLFDYCTQFNIKRKIYFLTFLTAFSCLFNKFLIYHVTVVKEPDHNKHLKIKYFINSIRDFS